MRGADDDPRPRQPLPALVVEFDHGTARLGIGAALFACAVCPPTAITQGLLIAPVHGYVGGMKNRLMCGALALAFFAGCSQQSGG